MEEVRVRGGLPGLDLEGEELSGWLAWATAQADRMDPFCVGPRSVLDEAAPIESPYASHGLPRR